MKLGQIVRQQEEGLAVVSHVVDVCRAAAWHVVESKAGNACQRPLQLQCRGYSCWRLHESLELAVRVVWVVVRVPGPVSGHGREEHPMILQGGHIFCLPEKQQRPRRPKPEICIRGSSLQISHAEFSLPNQADA